VDGRRYQEKTMLWTSRKQQARGNGKQTEAEQAAAQLAVMEEPTGDEGLSGNTIAASDDADVHNGDETTPADAEVDLAQESIGEAADDGGDTDACETTFQQIKADIHRRVIGKLDLSEIGGLDDEDLRAQIRRTAGQVIDEQSELLNAQERERVINEVIDETFGYGPLETILRDSSVSDILINGPKTVYVERRGRLSRTNVRFANDEHLLKIIQRIVNAVGRRGGTAGRRDMSHGGCSPGRRKPLQRDHSTAGPGRRAGIHPAFRIPAPAGAGSGQERIDYK
jgi:hypothetical protein